MESEMQRGEYALDARTSVWRRRESGTQNASPGDTEAQAIKKTLLEISDLSCGSDQLFDAIRDWPTQYHLSPERCNLLRPLRQGLRGRILEIGSQCGAITRLLGETGCEVVAVEPIPERAEATAMRCSGLSNVSVYCDSLVDLELAGSFDVILLPGVLERLGQSLNSENAAREMLARCESMLVEDGLLLLAVENRLALKYFAGAPERHTGIPFASFTGLRAGAYGRREIERELQGLGFSYCEFLYPVPGYEFARLILRPEAFRVRNGEFVRDILQRFSAFYDPRWDYDRLFSERAALNTVLQNNMAEDLAGAFLVLASKTPHFVLKPDVLAYSYSTARRRRFQKENLFTRENDRLFVRRARLYDDEAAPDGRFSKQELTDETYLEGRLWVNDLYDRLDRRDWTFEAILDWFKPYFDLLAQHAEEIDGCRVVPPHFLDCTPFNVIRNACGDMQPFDLEWIWPRPVPLDWVLFRGLFYALHGTLTVAAPQSGTDRNIIALTLRLMEACGLLANEERLEEIFELEERQQKYVAGSHAAISKEYWKSASLTPRLGSIHEELRRKERTIGELALELRNRDTRLSATEVRLRDRDRQIVYIDQQLSKSEAELEELRKQLAGMKCDGEELMAQVKAAEKDGLFVRRQLKEREQELAFLNDHLAERNLRVETVSREAARIEERAHRAQEHVTAMMGEIASLSQKVVELSAAAEHRDAALDRARLRNEHLEAKVESLSDELKELNAQLSSAHLKVFQCETESAGLQLALTEAKTHAGNLEREKNAAEVQIAELVRTVAEFQGSLSDVERQFEEKRVEAERLQTHGEAREARISELRNRIDELASATLAEHQRLGEAAAEIEKQEARGESLQRQVSAREERIQKLSSLVAKLRHELQAGDSRNRKLAQTADAERSARCRAEDKVVNLSRLAAENARRVSRMFVKLQTERAVTAEQRRVLEGAREENVHACHVVDTLHASLPFRVAIALRAMFDLAGKLSRRIAYPLVRLFCVWQCRPAVRREAIQMIRSSGLFDAEYYTEIYPDVARSGFPPLVHYIVYGDADKRNPHILFDTAVYKDRYPQGDASANALVHWLEHGVSVGSNPHPLFDVHFYLKRNPEVATAGMNPLKHFLTRGGAAGLDPHPLFDSSLYLEENPAVAGERMNPLVDYLRHGHLEGHRPHVLFDGAFYCKQNGRIAGSGVSPLAYYAVHGAYEDYLPHPLFDGQYYLTRYTDVKAAGLNPLAHYLESGAAEGRDPHPMFDVSYYCRQLSDSIPDDFNPLLDYLKRGGGYDGQNPHPLFDNWFYREQCADVDWTKMTPLEHYIRYGAYEGKDPHPLFHSSFYLEANEAVINSGGNPLVHYLKTGWREGRRPNPWFDPTWYLDQYPDVAASGMEPLQHYVLWGADEHRKPDPEFDAAWYLQANPDVAEAGDNALVHYLRYGCYEGRGTHAPETGGDSGGAVVAGVSAGSLSTAGDCLGSEIEDIKPFFDLEYYLRQCPEVTESGLDPYRHYLTNGAKEHKNPHPLFDSSFYLEYNLDVARSGSNPLVHFVRFGWAENRKPHPLFDCSYYLRRYPDVAASGMNPLLHYIQAGHAEGRWPNPLFDGGYYLRSNPDIVAVKVDPLVHFIEFGAAEGRRPHPAFNTLLYIKDHPEIAAVDLNPLVHYLGMPVRRGEDVQQPIVGLGGSRIGGCYVLQTPRSVKPMPFQEAPTILCVTHVPPYPPRAGNEYGEYRQLDYLERQGYRIAVALSPLEGDELSPEQFRVLSDRFPFTVVCGRDGLLYHSFPEGQGVLEALDGRTPRPVGPEIGEEAVIDPEERKLIGHEQSFCHDFLARLALHLEAALAPCVVLSQYIFHTRFLPLIRSSSLKVIQTHDMFSTKHHKVLQFGIDDALSVTPAQERNRLLRADVILSCQREEARAFAALVPEREVLEVPLDFDVVNSSPAQGTKILYVASDNPSNTKGLREFLSLAWPVILREVPDAELLVAGKICRTVDGLVENVRLLGLVDNLNPWYGMAKLTINPSVAGTGLKIKTAESLSHLRPTVSWPSGVDGFQPELAALCHTASNWREFADKVITILRSPSAEWFTAEQEQQIRHLLSPDTIYRPILQRLNRYCEEVGIPPRRHAGAERGRR
jgi:hypothetical protein